MAVLLSVQSGNFTSNTTWKVVDPISFANTETSATTLTTAFQTSSTFTPGAITIEGIAVKVAIRVASPNGTITVRLSTGGSAVTGTTVTLNVSDLPSTPSSGGAWWVYFKFSSPVTLLAATAYSVQATTSVSTQVALSYSVTPTSNWVRALVTSTNGTPSTRDTLIIAGEHTSAGVGTDYTVTMDNTNTTIFGSGSAVFPAIEVGRRGTFIFATASATNYQLWCNGSINVGGGGNFIIGSTVSPYPSDSIALIQFTNASANAYQINVRPHGTFLTCGMTKTGRDVLTSSVAASATSMTSSTSTGWYSGDNIVIGNATASIASFDARVLSATASGTSLTITSGLTNPKIVRSNTEVEIINLTRNIRFVGNTGANTGLYCANTYNGQVTIDLRYTEFRHGGFINNLIDATSTSILKFIGLSFWNLAGIAIFNDSGLPAGGSLLWSDCVFYNYVNFMSSFASVSGGTAGSAIFDSLWGISSSSNNISLLGNNVLTLNNCRFMGSAGSAIVFGNNSAYNSGQIVITNCVFKSNASGLIWSNGAYTLLGRTHILSNNKTYYNTAYGLNLSQSTGISHGWVLSNFEIFSNLTANILVSGVSDFTLLNMNVYGGPSPGPLSPIGVLLAETTGIGVFFDNCTFGTPSVHANGDFRVNNNTAHFYVKCNNCLMASANEFPNQSSMSGASVLYSARHDQRDGNHYIWDLFGTSRSDTDIFRNTSPSLRLTPGQASYKMESKPIYVPVKDGQSITVGAWVRTSIVGDTSGATYGGNFPRLICKYNSSNGTGTTDVILATASTAASGAWEYISGTTPTSIDNSAFEIVVDCDGTAGWVNVDDIYFSSQNSTKGFKYWLGGSPVPTSTSNNGSSVIFL